MYISENDRKTYKSIILLNELINGKSYKTILNGDDSLLEPLFVGLMANECVVVEKDCYVVTKKGQTKFDTFMQKYSDYLKVFDIFSYVDLTKAEFAFSKFFDFSSEIEWKQFKIDPRFEDLRIAVALFKKINPAEIVFMSFINENRFDTTIIGWQMDLLSEAIWNEIETICSTALKPEQFSIEEMEDMISQGANIMISLIKKENEIKQETLQNNVDENQDLEEDIVYYENYYDPLYINPLFLMPLFLW